MSSGSALHYRNERRPVRFNPKAKADNIVLREWFWKLTLNSPAHAMNWNSARPCC